MDLRSKNVTQGVERAPNRSLFYAMGYTKEELERPLIGVVSAHSEIVPGHFHLDKLTEAVKAGVRMAGGGPPEQTTVGMFILSAPRSIPGTILSQFGTKTRPSKP